MIVFSEGILHLKTIEYSVIKLCGNKAKGPCRHKKVYRSVFKRPSWHNLIYMGYY